MISVGGKQQRCPRPSRPVLLILIHTASIGTTCPNGALRVSVEAHITG